MSHSKSKARCSQEMSVLFKGDMPRGDNNISNCPEICIVPCKKCKQYIVDVEVWIMGGVVLQGLVMPMLSKAKKQYLCASNVYYDRVRKNCSSTGNKGPFVELTKPSRNLPHISSLRLDFRSPQILCKIKICGRLKCDIPANRGFLSSTKCKFAQNLRQSQIQS